MLFFHPAMSKWTDMDLISSWFDYLGIPLPTLIVVGPGRISLDYFIKK